MNFPGWLELPLTGTNCHGPKPVRATEVQLYGKKAIPMSGVLLVAGKIKLKVNFCFCWEFPDNFSFHKHCGPSVLLPQKCCPIQQAGHRCSKLTLVLVNLL